MQYPNAARFPVLIQDAPSNSEPHIVIRWMCCRLHTQSFASDAGRAVLRRHHQRTVLNNSCVEMYEVSPALITVLCLIIVLRHAIDNGKPLRSLLILSIVPPLVAPFPKSWATFSWAP